MTSFWLGVFVACFLAWGWWDSQGHTSVVTWKGTQRGVQAFRVDGSSFLIVGPPYQMKYFTIGKVWGYARWEAEPEKVWAHIEWTRDQSTVWVMPDAVVFVSFLVGWGGWLAWRREGEASRRRRKCRVIGDR